MHAKESQCLVPLEKLFAYNQAAAKIMARYVNYYFVAFSLEPNNSYSFLKSLKRI
jgi:hypothetical protein